MSEGLLDVIRKRRIIRKFADREVSDEQIETLLELAMCAPNRLDRRPWHFLVIRDKGTLGQLAASLRVRPYLTGAWAVIAVCGVPKRSPTWAMDASAAIQNMLIGATAMGLGTTRVGSPNSVTWRMCEELMRDLLAVPSDVCVAALVAVGYPLETPVPHGKHDRYEETKVHHGQWGNRGLS